MNHPPGVLDPSSKIDLEVLQHLHLVASKATYPVKARLDLQEVANWLREAPQIARDTTPFNWTCLECPPNGTAILSWQPLQRRGVAPASDGFIWAGPEQLFTRDMGNGTILEAYMHRTGFMLGEPATSRSRHRFRLVATQNSPMPVQIDSHLWIIHWSASDERFPVNAVPVPPRNPRDIQLRSQLRRLDHKDFMLSDHANWPTIRKPNMPPPAHMVPAPIPPQMAYPHFIPVPQHQVRAPPKQRRAAPHEAEPDDEDVRGDCFDTITPRELAVDRYKRNHEWMEEVVASHYAFAQITPPELGLGRAGELNKLTDGIFQQPVVQTEKVVPKPADKPAEPDRKAYIGKLPAGLADEFRKRVDDHTLATENEIQKMRQQHEKTMAAFRANGKVTQAEKALRDGPDVVNGESSRCSQDPDQVAAQVESHLGKKIVPLRPVVRVQDGGYLPKPPTPSVRSTDADTAMGGVVAPLSQVPSQSTTPQPRSHAGSVPPPAGPLASIQQQQQQQQQQQTALANTPGSLGVPFDTTNDFGDLNTAGEALDGYGMEMDSAFGDAFTSGVNASADTPADGQGTDM